MEYDALTIDTQVIETNSFDFDGGLLAQLKQFANGPTQVIIAHVVALEVLKHLREKTLSAKEALENAHKKAILYGLRHSGEKAFATPPDIQGHARTRFENYLKEIGATIIPADDLPIRDVLSLYFKGAAPFSNTGKKKSEFPDAIALLSLERWAKEKGQKVIAVSGDADWLAFASPHITVVGDLSVALAKLQEGAEQAAKIIEDLLQEISTPKRAELWTQLEQQLARQVTDYSVEADGTSIYGLESESVYLTLKSFEMPLESSDFTVVQVGSHKIVIQVLLQIVVEAHADFAMSSYDSIDHDYMSMGSTSAALDNVELEIETLITFEGDFEKDQVGIGAVEIISNGDTIDFGYVEPGYVEDPYYDDGEMGQEVEPNASMEADENTPP